ncbi:MAG: asparagine synthase (glutamine-hydrolyzing) [Pseudomonadota bacterium]
MCGICGIIYEDPSRQVDKDLLARMNRTMVHRGPDDEGYYMGRGAALAMRRLSIMDVADGHQPMSSEEGNVQAVCNGEIYNFKELRQDLKSKGHTFHTGSDTEVLPHLYQEYGADIPTKLNGMFGLAVWDEKERTLLLARDRMGKKPLYFTYQDGALIFGSELKAILANPNVARRLDLNSVAKYLAYEYIPAPHTIFEGIKKLEPGQLLRFKDGRITMRHYWDVPVGDERIGLSDDEASKEFLRLFKGSVKKRLMSDVPLGVFLSGGIDSSSVVAMMREHMEPHNIKTFSIAFEEKSFDESSYARKVAKHLGTDHREKLCTPRDLLALLPEVTSLLDEPFADPSIIPTYALSKFTRQHVTVALGGDGGDELFAGYPTFQAERAATWYRALPKFLRKSIIEPCCMRLQVSDENISFDFKVKQFLKGVDIRGIARHMVWMGAFSQPELKDVLAGSPPPDVFDDARRHAVSAKPASDGNAILYAYKKLYLAEDILAKVDRASMGASLEVRAPFLDYEVVEFVARLPYRMKLNGFNMKYLLKKSVDDLLPKGIAGRAKKGFGIPVAKWIKGPLREMTCDVLAEDKLRREGIFKPEEVTRLLNDHFKGRAENRKKLWTLIMFEKWLERWGTGGN